jgi:nicotinate-nucleotide adenylyltransferase
MRIAFFGGTFDPPHLGHIAIARAALERLALDQVLVAPVGSQPLKAGYGHSGFEDRLAMVALAVSGEPGLIASSIDAPLPDGQPNYTYDTLQRLRREIVPADELFCLLGADSFLTLRRWHQCTELLLFCNFIVAARPGFSLDEIQGALPPEVAILGEEHGKTFSRFALSGPGGQKTGLFVLPDLSQDISATEIRAALAEGGEWQTVLAPPVAEYIRSHGLYTVGRDTMEMAQ